MKIVLLYFICSIPFALCIIGGKDVPMNDESARFVVSLSDPKPFCSGALITYNFVLTAASCVKDKQLGRFHGHVARVNFNNNQEGVPVQFDKVFVKEPTGQKQVRNNIALLRLKYKIPTTAEDKVRTIPFSSDQKPSNGATSRVFGWGRTNRSTNEPANILQETSTYIEDLTSCRNHNGDVDESNICTHYSTASLCNFDAGDPLTSGSIGVLWGIATEDYACSENPILGDVFTRVESHKDWITEIIEKKIHQHGTNHTQSLRVHGSSYF